MVHRSQGTQANIPDVVVDEVIDMLKAELHEAILAFRAKDEELGFTSWISGLTEWAAIVLNFYNKMCQSPRNSSRSAPWSTHLGCPRRVELSEVLSFHALELKLRYRGPFVTHALANGRSK